MKCPVCGAEYEAPFCPECGYDGYQPPVSVAPTPAAPEPQLKREPPHQSAEPAVSEAQPERKLQHQSAGSAAAEKPRGEGCRLIATICMLLMFLCVGISIGMGIGNPEPTEPVRPWETNILRSDASSGDDRNSAFDTPVFGSEYQRDQIKTVTFLNTLADMPEDAWDVSEAGNGAVMAWVKPNGELYNLYIGGEGGVWAGKSCRELFAAYTELFTINFGTAFHTEAVKDMSSMFSDCWSLTRLDLSSFDTANVRDMSWMFSDSGVWRELNLSSFNTSNVQYMQGMFSYCILLEELELSNFDTAKVQDMSYMFYDCCSLENLVLSSFDTANVWNMSAMFEGASSLTNLELSSFDTERVQDMSSMFSECYSLEELDLSSFKTGNVLDMGFMFYECDSLTDLVLGDGFHTTIANTYDMFENCPAGEDYEYLMN